MFHMLGGTIGFMAAVITVYIKDTADLARVFSSLYRDMDTNVTLLGTPAIVSRCDKIVYPSVTPRDAIYQYEFWNLYSGRSSASLRKKYRRQT